MTEPIRQCVACRKRQAKNRLLRIVRTPDGHVVFDPKQSVSGRGLYVCSERSCIEEMRSKDLVGRTFQRQVPVSFYRSIAEQTVHDEDQSRERILGFAARARKLLLGVTAISYGIRKGKIKAVILDSAASDSTQKRVEALCKKGGVPLVHYCGRRPFEEWVGKPNCRCVGILDIYFARSILKSPKW